MSKYDDHLPLYGQAEIFARAGVSLETSTLSGWVGATAAALKPLVDALAADILAGDTLHVDDTPVPVLATATGKTKTGPLWTYVRWNVAGFGGGQLAADQNLVSRSLPVPLPATMPGSALLAVGAPKPRASSPSALVSSEAFYHFSRALQSAATNPPKRLPSPS